MNEAQSHFGFLITLVIISPLVSGEEIFAFSFRFSSSHLYPTKGIFDFNVNFKLFTEGILKDFFLPFHRYDRIWVEAEEII